jgi:hypothetical protein
VYPLVKKFVRSLLRLADHLMCIIIWFLPASTRSVPPGIHFALLLGGLYSNLPVFQPTVDKTWSDMIRHDQTWSDMIRNDQKLDRTRSNRIRHDQTFLLKLVEFRPTVDHTYIFIRHVQTCSDMFRHVQTCSDMFRLVFGLKKYMDFLNIYWIL